MRIEVNNKKEFAKALQIGGMLAGTSRIMPILDCVKIKAKNDQLTFVSSDNENAISKRLTEGVVTEGEEVFCVNMKDLMSYVKLIKSERFEMVIDEKQLEELQIKIDLSQEK